jgi:hypothetical protein
VWAGTEDKRAYYLFSDTCMPPVAYLKPERWGPTEYRWYWAQDDLWFDSLEEAKATVLAIVRMGA